MNIKKELVVIILILSGVLFCSCVDSSNPVSTNTDLSSDTASSDNDDTSDDTGNGENNNSEDNNTVEYTWDSSREFVIELTGDSALAEEPGAAVDHNIVTIKYPGTYIISGNLDDGRVIVDSDYDDKVILVMNGISISNSVSSPLYIRNAKDTEIVLNESTQNYLSDALTYTYDETEEKRTQCGRYSVMTIY